eukprot:Sdes_comp20105_c1_seq4m13111
MSISVLENSAHIIMSSTTNTHNHSETNGLADPSSADAVGENSGAQANFNGASSNNITMDQIAVFIQDLAVAERREQALLELSKKREAVPDLAGILWASPGSVAALLQEIIAIYPMLVPPALTAHASNRVCNALALLQCVASHPDTRKDFIAAQVPLYLYAFLSTQSKTRPFEYLRLTSLGVIGALVKTDDSETINFLLQTEIIPLCLRIMENGSELSKTVATFIVQKILMDDLGLSVRSPFFHSLFCSISHTHPFQYICATYERFYAVATVLAGMVQGLADAPAARLLKHIVRCYHRLSDNARAREALRQCLPEPLRDATFGNCLKDDATTKQFLSRLLHNLSETPSSNVQRS